MLERFSFHQLLTRHCPVRDTKSFSLKDARFLRTLHSHIRDKSRLHACTELSSYVESESGVTVKTTEGKTFEGSILIGADGVHSKTRNLVAEKLQSENKKLCKALQECRFQAPTSVLPTHYLLFGISLR